MSDFLKICRAATERLFQHRKTLRRTAVRIGFWPDGMVIITNINAFSEAESASNQPRLIPWSQLETMDEASLLAIIDHQCECAAKALGIEL